LEGPLGEYPELVEKGIQHRHHELRRRGRDGRGPCLHRCDGRREDPGVREALGAVLWEYQLPAGGYATPSVYMINGRQYVAIAAGGSGKNGDEVGRRDHRLRAA
jgi:quinoprotein glucose dehydrogenase